MYPQSTCMFWIKNKKCQIFSGESFNFYNQKIFCLLHGPVLVMRTVNVYFTSVGLLDLLVVTVGLVVTPVAVGGFSLLPGCGSLLPG